MSDEGIAFFHFFAGMLSRIAMAYCQASARADVGPSVRTYPFLPAILSIHHYQHHYHRLAYSLAFY